MSLAVEIVTYNEYHYCIFIIFYYALNTLACTLTDEGRRPPKYVGGIKKDYLYVQRLFFFFKKQV